MRLKTGSRFYAQHPDELPQLYQFIGVQVSEPTHCSFIELYNIQTQTKVRVDFEWFQRRKLWPHE